MGWFGDDSDEAQAYNQATEAEQPEHKASLTHELIAAAASYEAAKAYEEHCAANGQPESHSKAKEIMAAITGAIVDRTIETKGLDFIDAEKAKHDVDSRISSRKRNEEYVAQNYEESGYTCVVDKGPKDKEYS
ncbi:hypothetical protein R3P38DRAFT_2795166 [Favolaschia claudopus]|uniref:Uncharacterized protein n=1 Tax=Favolaschia claudopus TaxID=2862362 RepID=A0AAW0A6S0_9AGAR